MNSLAIITLLLGTTAYAVEVTSYASLSQKTETYNFTLVCGITGYKVEGMTWSDCRSGKTQAIGCVLESGEKLKFGELYTDAHAQYKCEQQGDMIKLRPIACILDGQVLPVLRGTFSGKFFYRCSHRPDGGIGLDITGCKDEKLNIQVPFKGTFRRKDFQFMCDTDGKKAFEVGVGCYVEKRGVVKIGQRYRLGDYFYECSRKGQRGIKTEVVGCSDEKGTLVEVGDRFRTGAIMYECVDTEEEGIDFKPVGCAIKDQTTSKVVEYSFGEKWYESYKEGLGYTMMCDQDGEDVGPKIVQCIASTDSDRMSLEIGCGAKFAGKAFVCKDMEEGRVMAKLRSVSKGKTYMDVLAENGVTVC